MEITLVVGTAIAVHPFCSSQELGGGGGRCIRSLSFESEACLKRGRRKKTFEKKVILL